MYRILTAGLLLYGTEHSRALSGANFPEWSICVYERSHPCRLTRYRNACPKTDGGRDGRHKHIIRMELGTVGEIWVNTCPSGRHPCQFRTWSVTRLNKTSTTKGGEELDYSLHSLPRLTPVAGIYMDTKNMQCKQKHRELHPREILNCLHVCIRVRIYVQLVVPRRRGGSP